MSVATIALSAVGLWALIARLRQSDNTQKLQITPIIFLGLFYLWCALGYWYSDNKDEAVAKLTVRLPLLTLPLLYFQLVKMSDMAKSLIALAFCYAVYLPAAVSTINYFNNKALFDALVLQSKPIPVEFGYGIHHIEFSVLCGLSVVIGLYWILNPQLYQYRKPFRYAFILFTLLNVISIHILSARTGLLGMYAALGTGVVWFILKKQSVRQTLWIVLAAIALPVIAYTASASLRNRVANTIEDLNTVKKGDDANEHSFAMRVEAWKTSSDIIASHPLMGVGIGDAQAAMQQQYVTNHSNLAMYNRKNPHNQFLETAVQSGLVASALLLTALLLPLFYRRWRSNILVVCTLILYIVSFQFESVLDMQAGVIPFAFFYVFILSSREKQLTD